MNEPIIFEPLFMERVWGGRRLATVFGKNLPHGALIGESWEIVDRADAQSVVHGGALRGKTLHELWTQRRTEVFGKKFAVHPSPRFPLMFKLLDCRETLSVQVHPPAHAAALAGEPKTEMWFVAVADAGAEIFAGLKKGVTRDAFERALHDGGVAEKLHRIATKSGDAIFVPSGRVHAIGAGNLIVEVQQNSDTTYRVFDWNRAGLDGKLRALHVAESMKSIDFADFEPSLFSARGDTLVECEFFRVEKWELREPRIAVESDAFAIFNCVAGEVELCGARFKPGEFFLAPAGLVGEKIHSPGESATVLRTTLPA
jgi:mannose-6-phosphate isomerase